MLAAAVAVVVWTAGCGEDPAPSCSPGNCSGCCDLQGRCQGGESATACGRGGAACTACGAGGSCTNGQCTGGCDSSSCPGGCCQGGQCMPGDTSSACGTGGLACIICQGSESCVDGRCTTCNASSCPDGCCQGSRCMPGTAQDACGKGGLTCAVCTAPKTCIDQVCSTGSCGPGTCSGCCDTQDTCQNGDTSTACGVNGQACETCEGSLACVNGQCAWDPQADWKVTVVSATLLPPPAGKVWDPGNLPGFTEPDVYVKVSCAGKSGKTGTEDDTFTPGFSDEVLTATAQQLGAGVTIEVYDYDLIAPPDELIGGCNVSFSKATLEQGSFTVQSCGGQDVQSVLLSFALK